MYAPRLESMTRYALVEGHLVPGATERAGTDLSVVVLCSEGYTSSLAAASLQDLGLRATDVIGGFSAWKAAGLPHA